MLATADLRLAVVSNWDCSLPERLGQLGLRRFDAIVSSAEAGVPKPEPEPFLLALERLETAPERTLHVGDEPVDEQGARAVGMRFAPAPLSSVEALDDRTTHRVAGVRRRLHRPRVRESGAGGEPAEDVLYQYDTAVAGLVQYAIVLAIVLWITRGHQRELLAFGRPARGARRSGGRSPSSSPSTS